VPIVPPKNLENFSIFFPEKIFVFSRRARIGTFKHVIANVLQRGGTSVARFFFGKNRKIF